MTQPPSQPSELSTTHSVEFAQQVATAAENRLPLPPALRALAGDLPSKPVGAALLRLADALERGEAVEVAIGQVGLPPHVQGIILAGIRSGSLAKALMQYAEHRRTLDGLRQQVMLSTVYPAIVLAGLIVVLFGAAHLIGSGAQQLLEEFGVAVPLPTYLLIQFGKLSIYLALGIAAVAATVLVLGPGQWRGGWKRLPLIGPAWRWTAQAEFCQLLSLLVERNMPLPAALRLTADGLTDESVAAASRRLAAAVERGVPLGTAVGGERTFARTLSPWLGISQQSGALADGLATAAEMFRARVRSQVGLLKTVLPPIMLVLVGWGVSFIGLAFFMPLLSLIRALT